MKDVTLGEKESVGEMKHESTRKKAWESNNDDSTKLAGFCEGDKNMAFGMKRET